MDLLAQSHSIKFALYFYVFPTYHMIIRNYILIMIAIILLLTAWSTHSIRFNYNLHKYQIQCFHQSVEKDTRYQISIKGETSEYYLHVVENQPVHEDIRTTMAEYKHYSAYAQSSTVITFCIGNLGETAIFFDIQFYHGLFLEDSFQKNVQGHELQDLSNRWTNMLNMVESNYEIYKRHLINRRSSSGRLTLVLSVMVVGIIIGSMVMKWLYYRKIMGYLHEKKLV